MKTLSTVVIQKEGKWFVARSLELGVTSQGKNIEEAKKNLTEAIELYIEDSPRVRKQLPNEAPLITTLEITHA